MKVQNSLKKGDTVSGCRRLLRYAEQESVDAESAIFEHLLTLFRRENQLLFAEFLDIGPEYRAFKGYITEKI